MMTTRLRALALVLGGVAGLGCATGLVASHAAGQDASKPAPARRSATGLDPIPEQVRVIDEQIAAQWEANKLTPSRKASDYEFIRRASLDIVGRIASVEEIRAFESDRRH